MVRLVFGLMFGLGALCIFSFAPRVVQHIHYCSHNCKMQRDYAALFDDKLQAMTCPFVKNIHKDGKTYVLVTVPDQNYVL